MRGVGADPDDLYKYGQIELFDYGNEEDDSEEDEEVEHHDEKPSKNQRPE